MLKKTLVSLAVTGALHFSNVHALELGELTAISKVNEPFKAEIQLTDVDSLTPEEIFIQIGSESEFRQANIVPNKALSQLKFQVRKKSNGDAFVDVVSLVPLEVDSLKFVLSARWPSGKVAREYDVPLTETVLIESEESQVVQSTKTNDSGDKPTQATIEFTDPREVARKALNALPTDGTASVQQGDTLWAVADSEVPKSQLTVYQTMMAIQALNEEAFYANNVNLMKEGAVLRLPTKEQIELFNAVLSKKEFDKQTQEWKGFKQAGQVAKEIESAQLNTQANAKPASQVVPESGDVLSLITGASVLPEQSVGSNEADEKAKAAIADLERKLSASEENADKAIREKTELGEQLQELNNQLATLEELIALKDAQLAELQQQFVAAQNAMQEQKNTIDQLLEADQIRRERELEEESTLLNKFLTNPLYLSISSVLLLLLGIMLGLLFRRGNKKGDVDSYAVEDDLSDFSMTAPPVVNAEPESTSTSDFSDVEDDVDDDPFAFDFENSDDDLEDLDSEPEQGVADDSLDDIEDFDGIDDIETLDELDEDDLDFDLDDDLDDLEDVAGDDFDEAIPTVDINEEPIFEESEIEVSAELEESDNSEDESFVSNLLDDSELQEDKDESALFNIDPNDSIANSIEETLSESLDTEEMSVEFTAEDAAAGEEESDEEEDIDFFDASGDEVATKLDLARAYVDMGDEEGARVILEDVMEIGNEEQVGDAKSMIDRMSPSE